MSNLVIETRGMDFNAVDRDILIIIAKLIKFINKDFYFSKWNESFYKLLPNTVQTTEYGKVIFAIKNGLKALEEHGAIKIYKPEGKRYNLVGIKTIEVLNKVIKNSYKVLKVKDTELKKWFEDELAVLEGNKPQQDYKSEFASQEVAFNDLF
jgi:hypothetical protein